MSPEDRIGRMIADRYRLESVIGRGGMGFVYRATHTWTERPVAVKILLPEYADDSHQLQRFFQEAKATVGLRHPNVVDVLDMGEDDDGSAFLVLELLEGEPLSARLEREGRLEPAEALRILLPLMDALEVAHERGIIHRDLKPDNVFLAQGHRGVEVPKLLDFGVAKLLEGAVVQTRAGMLLGTPGYMSPEQVRGERDLTPASDVWAMGVILFYSLSGELPVEKTENPTTMLMSVVTKDPKKLGETSSEVPPRLAAAVDGALQRDAKERYQTMADLIDSLVAAAEADDVEVSDPRSSTPRGAP